jgi:SAM-dependent methyltransferase
MTRAKTSDLSTKACDPRGLDDLTRTSEALVGGGSSGRADGGRLPAMDERDAFLVDFHRCYPGLTARLFARGRTEDGGSSYDGTVDRIAETDGDLLDLGCGCGYLLERIRARQPRRRLVGVDLSADELAVARARPPLAGVDLVRARADAVPLASGRFGAIASHMAFMLMTPVEAVVAEIHRLLAPGGLFVAAVGGGPCADDAFERFLTLLHRRRDEIARLPPRLGDKRARSPEGLRALFRPETGFEPPRVVDRTLRVDGTVDQVWQFLAGVYELGFASAELLASLRGEVEEAARAMADRDGAVPCALRVTYVTARRAG